MASTAWSATQRRQPWAVRGDAPAAGSAAVAAAVSASYAVHAARERSTVEPPALLGAPDSLDARRHWRMYERLRPLVLADPGAVWLTIGDSGADAAALRRLGAERVLASSLSAAPLRELARQGLLDGVEILELNAERLDRLDRPVDYLLCKEAYHHFPRPPIAFYGFLETARRAVALIEPVDMGRRFPLELVRSLAKRWIRGDPPERLLFEDWGNYIFRLSLPEVDRMLTALQVERWYVACHNDFYHPRLSPRPTADRLADRIERLGVAVQDLAAGLGLMGYGKAAVVIPTGGIPLTAAEGLLRQGFRERRTARNPYAAAAAGTG
jgi:hypothetical protein